MAGRPPSKPEIKASDELFSKKRVATFLALDFKGGEGLVDNLTGSEGGGLPRWHNLKHTTTSSEIKKSTG